MRRDTVSRQKYLWGFPLSFEGGKVRGGVIMWMPIDIVVAICLSWGASVLALYCAHRGGMIATNFYRFLVVVTIVSGFYFLGWALRCLTCVAGLGGN